MHKKDGKLPTKSLIHLVLVLFLIFIVGYAIFKILGSLKP